MTSESPNIKTPDKVWGNILSLYGLRFKKPVRMVRPDWNYPVMGEEDNGATWFHKNGNDCVDTLGIYVNLDYTYCTLASTDRDEVQAWMDGASAVYEMLKRIGSNV